MTDGVSSNTRTIGILVEVPTGGELSRLHPTGLFTASDVSRETPFVHVVEPVTYLERCTPGSYQDEHPDFTADPPPK